MVNNIVQAKMLSFY